MPERRLERLVEAVLMIAGDMDLPTVLQRIVEAAAALVDAEYAALGVIGEDQFLSEFLYTGIPSKTARAIGHLPEGHGILGLLIHRPETIRLRDLTEHPESYGFPEHHPEMRSFLGTPVRVGGTVFGNLYLAEKHDGSQFTESDEELVVALAAIAGAAIERVRLHEEVSRITVLEDRERIGRDLHDTVIQRLFATGLGLQALSRRVSDDAEVAARIEDAVEDLDEVIREIRSTIFALQSGEAVGTNLRRSVLALVRELEGSVGLRVSVRFDGPIDSALTAEQAEHVGPVIREGLTNVARHAQATRAEVVLFVGEGRFRIDIEDDGVGGAAPGGGLGLGNLGKRAERRGGELELLDSDLGGTCLRWWIPLE